jgi:hypothetical protein
MKNMSILATLDRKINHSDRDFSALLEVNNAPLHNANPYLGVKSPSTSVTEGQSPPILWEEQPQFKVQSFNRRDKGWRSVSGWLYEANKERSLLF